MLVTIVGFLFNSKYETKKRGEKEIGKEKLGECVEGDSEAETDKVESITTPWIHMVFC